MYLWVIGRSVFSYICIYYFEMRMYVFINNVVVKYKVLGSFYLFLDVKRLLMKIKCGV